MLTGCSDKPLKSLKVQLRVQPIISVIWSELPLDGKDIEASVKNELDTSTKHFPIIGLTQL